MEQYLSDPEAILLLVIILGGLAIILTFGDILMPVFVSIAIAILLQCWVSLLVKYKCPPTLAYWIVYIIFLTAFIGCIVFLLPLMWRQCVNLVNELPKLVQGGRELLLQFVQSGNGVISQEYVDSLVNGMIDEVQGVTKKAITLSISSIPGILTWIVYAVLVPLLVFFFLKDHTSIVSWFKSFLPEKRGLIRKVWYEMNEQMANYVRGKITEIIIVTIATYIVFIIFDMRYSMLLAVLVGLSVVIPYVGIVVVTIPVVLVGYLQWGFDGGLTGKFAMMLYSYAIVELLDGAVLVPLLFSEAVNLHPVAIVIAILFFGSIWGFWGVFFAIPLATLVKSVLYAWPKHSELRRHSRMSRY
jgi:putative permease